MSKLDRLIAKLCPEGVEYVALGNVLKIRNGRDHKGFADGNVPVYGTGGIMTYIDTFAYDKPSVLIPRKGSIDKLYYVETPFWTVDTIFYTEIFTDIIIPKFVYYYLQMAHLEDLNTAGGVPSLTQTVLNKVSLPLPPLPVQAEIVRILDKFTELTAELEAELEARKKQYEYYRNELLSFKEKIE
jgi:type I restriction enzyme S subunit